MKHQGEIVEKAVRESGIALTRLAKKLGVTRQTIYNYFASPQLSWDVIVDIGQIIGHDFTEEIKGKKGIKEYRDADATQAEQLREALDELNSYKKKYIELLEQHQKLLQKKNDRK